MAQIAVTIIDPSNNRSAHLVETQRRVQDVIASIVARLKLPAQASYQLFLLGSERALPADKSLAESGVPAGAELLLKPVRNQILKMILDKLYGEAQGYVEEQAWTLAKEKLEELLRLDPTYPDPLGLEKVTASHTGLLRSVPASEQLSTRSQSIPAATRRTVARPLMPRAQHAASVPPVTSASSGGAGAYQLSPQAAKSSGLSCLFLSLMAAGVVVVGGVLLLASTFFLPGILNDLAGFTGFSLPGTETLGTGDVQVTLRWDNEADLDLHVIDPDGEEIWFANPESASGGILDVDANGACEGASQPVENVYWPTGNAPSGSYLVVVVYFQSCAATQPTEYEVTVTVDGEVIEVINAQIATEGEEHPVIDFDY